jgi:hypothetical protein
MLEALIHTIKIYNQPQHAIIGVNLFHPSRRKDALYEGGFCSAEGFSGPNIAPSNKMCRGEMHLETGE